MFQINIPDANQKMKKCLVINKENINSQVLHQLISSDDEKKDRSNMKASRFNKRSYIRIQQMNDNYALNNDQRRLDLSYFASKTFMALMKREECLVNARTVYTILDIPRRFLKKCTALTCILLGQLRQSLHL